VELLIVIVILGILATVTVFAVRGITDQGQTNACSTDRRTFETAIEAFYAQNQRDPRGVDELLYGPRPANAPTVALTSGSLGVLKTSPSTTNWTFSAGPPAAFTAVTEANGGACAA
jgi:type II secretory pathway pseudopilin PulG